MRELAGFEPGSRFGGGRWREPPVAHPDYAMLRRVLHEARTTPEAWGGRLWFVFLPKWARFAHPGEEPGLDAERATVLEAAKAEGMQVIDGVEVLTAGGDPLDSFPYRLRGHYSVRGYRLMGEAIRDRVSTASGG